MDVAEQGSETDADGAALTDFKLSEARAALSANSYSSVLIDGHLVVFRSGFDLTISGEPYLALMFLFSFKSGEYYAREGFKSRVCLNSNRILTGMLKFFF